MKSKTANKIARTGRVQAWIDNPTDRLPLAARYLMSMTVWKDQMESKQAEICVACSAI